VRCAGGPVYGLGGVNAKTIGALALTGVSGVAAVEALV
jgi:thiamine monophosphate synthase